MSVLPLPLTEHDRAAGYWWELSMRQIETSRTLVFDAPRRARGVLRGAGAPTTSTWAARTLMELIFTGRTNAAAARQATQPIFKTKVVTRDTEVTINAFYKHSRIKQYLERRAGAAHRDRASTHPDDLRCHAPSGPSRRVAGQGP